MTNKEIATILYEMAAFLDMENVQFKPRAYEKAAEQIEGHGESLRDAYHRDGAKALKNIPGVGASIAKHIEELLTSGKFKEHEDYKARIPVEVSQLMRLDGMGPKKIKDLWDKLRIRNLDDLEKAAQEGKIRSIPRFGKKSEENILRGIDFLKKSAPGRQLLGNILPEILKMQEAVRSFPDVRQVQFAGSARRKKETIGDIDMLVTSFSPSRVMDSFVQLPMVDHIEAKGPTKTTVKLKNGMDADLRVVPEESFGAALLYFTGSKDHNIVLREIAIKKGWKLNEYGLYQDTKMIAGRTEEEVYKALGLAYIEPEMRENTGEIELAREGTMPELIGYDDLKGDLQTQTDWTDGKDSIEDMALTAAKMGLEYIVITDHTKGLPMTRGSDEKKLREQMVEIDALNVKLKKQKQKITVLKGAEVNIQKDGTLDILDEVLAELDVVGASVHSHFDLPREEQTRRVIRAMENSNVDILFHPTSRLIQRREAIEIDMDKIIRVAKRTGTVLEIDSLPDRLDLRDEYIRRCVQAGVKLSIDSDAHSIHQFSYLELGIAQARRGWAPRKLIVNALPLKKFLQSLKNQESPQRRRVR